MTVAAQTGFWLLRHALVDAPSRAVVYGANDVPVCEATLRAEAPLYRWLAARLPAPAHWAVSPLSRTRRTAEAIFAAGYGPAPLAAYPGLIEQNLGAWQGLPHEAVTAALSLAPHPFWPHAAEEAPPGGETLAEVIARVGATLEDLASRFAGQEVVAVSHGGAIRAALAHAMGAPGRAVLHISVRNLSLTRLERHPQGWRVVCVNAGPEANPMPRPG